MPSGSTWLLLAPGPARGQEGLLPFPKHYFPINYTLNVHYEEVLRPANISRLLSLRYLWYCVNVHVVLKIHAVLPEQHPSWAYMQQLTRLLDDLAIGDLVDQVYASDAASSRKPVRPKSLLDNCVRVMKMLYSGLCK
uniref:Interleukin 34 n=1 Tax=Sphenodon punctatus TaxID=8508 RepID=A0A8D0GP48_SPHPU